MSFSLFFLFFLKKGRKHRGGGERFKLKFIFQKKFFLENTFKKIKFTVRKFFNSFFNKITSKLSPVKISHFLCSCFKYK